MNSNDGSYLKTLTDPKTPFLDIVRAVHRAHQLLCMSARDILRAELPNLQEAFGLSETLNPDHVNLHHVPKPDQSWEWNYDFCSDAARIWLPEPVESNFWVFVEFHDEGIQVGLALEFSRKGRLTRWLQSLEERPQLIEVGGYLDGYVLARRTSLNDIACVEEALAELLGDFLAELRGVRRAAAET